MASSEGEELHLLTRRTSQVTVTSRQQLAAALVARWESNVEDLRCRGVSLGVGTCMSQPSRERPYAIGL